MWDNNPVIGVIVKDFLGETSHKRRFARAGLTSDNHNSGAFTPLSKLVHSVKEILTAYKMSGSVCHEELVQFFFTFKPSFLLM